MTPQEIADKIIAEEGTESYSRRNQEAVVIFPEHMVEVVNRVLELSDGVERKCDCGQLTDRPYWYCPFCGGKLPDKEEWEK